MGGGGTEKDKKNEDGGFARGQTDGQIVPSLSRLTTLQAVNEIRDKLRIAM